MEIFVNILIFFVYALFGALFFEPLIINFIYFYNISLFEDIILTEKNKEKLELYYRKKGCDFNE